MWGFGRPISRSIFPAMVAEYKTMQPHKKLLKAKLHELYLLLAPIENDGPVAAAPKAKAQNEKPQP